MKLLSLEVKRSAGKDSLCEIIGFHSKDKNLNTHSDYFDYNSLLSQLKSTGELSGRAGSLCLVRNGGLDAQHVLFVSLGDERKGLDAIPSTERLRRLGAAIAAKLAAERIGSATLHLESFLLEEAGMDAEYDDAAQAICEGLWLSTYKFKKYFSKQDDGPLFPAQINIVANDPQILKAFEQGRDAAEIIADAIYVARDLGNEPSNELTPDLLAKDMQTMAQLYKLKCTVLDERKLKQEGMGLLLGVGQGSVNPPRLIALEYNPPKANKKTKTLALVGKGMTFDSGGISIKPSLRMEDMKHDMCGASAVIGATLAIARLKLPIRVICVVAAAENMPDGKAIAPGNILVSRSGKTVEVNNTDAEGRLVLADALDWVQDRKPDYIINAATLTGAVGVALGKVCSGLMGNDDDLSLAICQASEHSAERVWELPMYSEYFDDLRSEYADMRNVGDNGNGGAIRGGMFLKQFIRDGMRWAHLDLASMAYDHGIVPYNPRKGGSGWGVRLLVDTARLLSS